MPVPVIPLKITVTPTAYVVHGTGSVTAEVVNEGRTPIQVTPGLASLARTGGQCHVAPGAPGLSYSGDPATFTLAPNQDRVFQVNVTVPRVTHGTADRLITFTGATAAKPLPGTAAGAVIHGQNDITVQVPVSGHQTACHLLTTPPTHSSPAGLYAGLGAAVLAVLLILAVVVRKIRQHRHA